MSWAELTGGVLREAMAAFGTPFSFSPRGPGRPAGPFTFQPDGVTTLTGVFDEAHHLMETSANSAPVSTIAPVLGVRLADLPVPPLQGDVIVVAGISYKIAVPQPDGQGGSKLILEAV
jgi:hypothetical protein